jgi:ligand-binding sensor domain-containing protein/signal transduction histidine kinase
LFRRRPKGWNRAIPLTLVVMTAGLVVFAPSAAALNPSRAVTQYVKRSWTVEQGLPQDSVQTIAQTLDGYLWLGTQEGLVRFDGVTFTAFNAQNTPQIPSDNVTCLYRDRSGKLWIATANGIAVYHDGRFSRPAAASDVRAVFGVAEDSDGVIWLASSRMGLQRYANGRVTAIGKSDGLEAPASYSVRAAGTNLWVGSSAGLYRRVGARFERVPGGFESEPIYSLYDDGNGTVWVGTGNGAYRYDGKNAILIPEVNGEEVWGLNGDRQGVIWIGSRRGLWRWYRGALARLGEAEGLSDDFVDSILVDAEQNLWVGTHLGGLNQFRDGIFMPLTKREGVPDDTIWSIDADAFGMWIGSENGVHRLQNGQWTTVPAMKGKLVYSVVGDGEGGVWAGTADQGVMHVRGDAVTTYDHRHGLPTDMVTALQRDVDGTLWIGTAAGLVHYVDGRIEQVDPKNGPTGCITTMLVDREKRLWVGTSGGFAAVRENGRFSRTFRGVALPREDMATVYQDRSGDFWFSTQPGLHRLNEKGVFLYTTRHGLPNATVSRFFEDDAGSLWMSSSSGVFRVRKRELDDVRNGKAARVSPEVYGVRDGLPASETASYVHPPSWRAPDGRMWIATARGIGVLDPHMEHPPLRNLPIVESVLVDGVAFARQGAVQLPVGADRVEVHYTIPTFVAPDRMVFRYRLKGYDRDWIAAGNRRAAYYTNLPPGTYHFTVAAAAPDGEWIEAASSIEFHLPPPFYRTAWFIVLAVLSALTLVWVMHTRRLRAMRSRHEAVLDERARIAREFHDTIAQGLTGLSMHLEGALSSLNDPETARGYLITAKKLATNSLREAKRAVSGLRPKELEGQDLPTALRRMLELMTEQLPVVGALSVRGEPRRLADMHVENHLLRIAQEAVTNALRHSHAQHIEVILHYEPSLVRLCIRDDGQGSGRFTLDQLATTTYGVRGMRERAEQIGASFAARNQAGRGLEIMVEVTA